jgi:hypothetical protein
MRKVRVSMTCLCQGHGVRSRESSTQIASISRFLSAAVFGMVFGVLELKYTNDNSKSSKLSEALLTTTLSESCLYVNDTFSHSAATPMQSNALPTIVIMHCWRD